MIALHFVSLRKQSIIGTQCPECGCSWILHSLHSLYFVRACTNLELSTNLDWQKWRFLRNILPHTTWCYTTIITMLWYYKDFQNVFDLSKRNNWEWNKKKDWRKFQQPILFQFILTQAQWHLDQMFLNLKMKIEIVMVIAVLGIVCAKTAFLV